jgi:hypothetical protein
MYTASGAIASVKERESDQRTHWEGHGADELLAFIKA